MPITTSSSDSLHPLSACVCEYRTLSTTSAVTIETVDWSSWMKKFVRYCSSFIEPTRKKSQASRSAFNCPAPSIADRRVAAHGEAPDEERPGRQHRNPERLHREPAEQLGGRVVGHERLD